MRICSNKNKLLTIAIPTYNRASYLKLCLEHLIHQVDDEIEILICDNASEDNTSEIVSFFLKRYSFIRYIRHEQNIGPDANFLFCYREASGRYIQLIGDDDVLLDNSIYEIKKCILENKYPTVIHLNLCGFKGDFNPNVCEQGRYNISKNIVFNDKNKFIEFIGINITNISMMIINKEIIDTIDNLEQYLGTYLLQAHVAIQCIARGGKSVIISHVCIAAKADNGGGYNFYTVFAKEWKKVLFNTGLIQGYMKKSLNKVYKQTIKELLSYWVIYLKLNRTLYHSEGTLILFMETWEYPCSWIYLYPSIILPKWILKKIKNIYKIQKLIRNKILK